MDALVLISGWSGPGLEWRFSPIRTYAPYYDFKTVHFNQCNNGWSDIEHNARKCIRLTESLTKTKLYENVYAVGHSMGGLIAKYAFHHGDGLQGYVSIASPYGGVQKALLAPWSKSAKQMVPGSDFLNNLNRYMPTEQILNIACRFDQVVQTEKSIESEAENQLVVNHTHMSCIYSASVAHSTLGFLKTNSLNL